MVNFVNLSDQRDFCGDRQAACRFGALFLYGEIHMYGKTYIYGKINMVGMEMNAALSSRHGRLVFVITKTEDDGEDVCHDQVTDCKQKAMSESFTDLVGQDQVHDKGNHSCDHCQNAEYDTEAVSVTAVIYNIRRDAQDHGRDEHEQSDEIIRSVPAPLI